MLLCVQLTPLQFYYSLQTESQRAAAAAAAAATFVKEERSSDSCTVSSCRRSDIRASSSGRVVTQTTWKRQRPQVAVESKLVKRETASSKLPRCKPASSKAERRRLTPSRSRDAEKPTASKDSKDSGADSERPVERDDGEKRDSEKVGQRGETEEQTVSGAGEKDCCGGDTACSAVPADSVVQPEQDAKNDKMRIDEEDRDCVELSTSLPPASTSTPKLKIFKCSESKRLCVRSADVVESPVGRDAALPKLCLPKNLVIRQSGSPVDARPRKRDADKRERRRRHRRQRHDPTETVVDETTTAVTELDAALSPVPSVPDTVDDATADRPHAHQVCTAACSPLSGSDNVVSSSTSSQLLPDEDDDDLASAARRSLSTLRPRKVPADEETSGGDATDQAASGDGTGDSATTLRVPIRLGGQSGQTGELLLRLPQNVSVQCSFRADQILIASSPATSGTEQTTVSTGDCGGRPANDDTELPSSPQHVSDMSIIINQSLIFREV